MNSLDFLKEITTLIRKYGTPEQFDKAVALRNEVEELHKKIKELTMEHKILRKQMDFAKRMKFEKPFYYTEKDDQPYCAHCWEVDKVAIHLTGPVTIDDHLTMYDEFTCTNCNRRYKTNVQQSNTSY